MKNLWAIFGGFVVGACLGAFAAVTLIREAVPLRSHIWVTVTFVGAFLPILAVLWIWFVILARKLRKNLGEKAGGLILQLIAFLLIAEVILFIFVAGFYFTAIA